MGPLEEALTMFDAMTEVQQLRTLGAMDIVVNGTPEENNLVERYMKDLLSQEERIAANATFESRARKILSART